MSRRWLVGGAITLFVVAFGLLPLYGDSLFESPAPESAPEPLLPPNEYTDQSAPYADPGPHSMVLVAAVSSVTGLEQGYGVDDRLLPAEWGVYDDDESRPRRN